ncbi:MAG: hypothetical protein KatS3mg031_2274 [Chitinophagales bacterium]|nr:MAG: hypothetical protein KatS3mg031_2274 [Chitinophagales bacterium]
MDNREEIKKELRELAPRLAQIRHSNPFSVPEGYFHTLPEQTLKKIKAHQLSQPWTEKLEIGLSNLFSLIFQPRYAVPVAVALLLIVAGINLKHISDSAQIDFAQRLAAVPTADLDAYVMEVADESDLTAYNAFSAGVSWDVADNISTDDITDYLINNSELHNIEEEFL